MAINIFQDAEKKSPAPASDIVGRFRAGRQIQGRPTSLKTWRVTSSDPNVMARVGRLLGVEEGPQEWDTKTEERLEIITNSTEVDIVLTSKSAIRSEMVLWGRKGKVRSCDGVTMADGQPCVCPSSLSERMECAKQGTACDPSISLLFSLAADLELGRFRFQTGSWTAARSVAQWEEALADFGGSASATLSLVERTRKDGVAYTVATLDNFEAFDEEEPF